MSLISNNGNTPLKPKLLPTPFDNTKSNENSMLNSFGTPKIYKQEITPYPLWYNPSKNVDLNSSNFKIEDPTVLRQKWDFPSPKPFQFRSTPKLANFHRDKDFYCDTCDRSFPDAISLQKHQTEHTTCNIQGCKFRAHPKIVSLHKKMQHYTGLAKKIMSLDTPEDIQKWREERKRNFPTAENRERKKQEKEEKKSRGEVITNKYFGKMRGRGKNRNNVHTQQQNEESPNQQRKQNYFRGRGRGGRGRFRGRNRYPFGFEKAPNEIVSQKNNTKPQAFKRPITSTEAKEPVLKPFEGILKNYDEIDISDSETLNHAPIKKAKISKKKQESEKEVDTSSENIERHLELQEIQEPLQENSEEKFKDKLLTIVNSIKIDDNIKALIISEINQKDCGNTSELEEGEIKSDGEEIQNFRKDEMKTVKETEIIANNQEIKAKEIEAKNKNFFEATDSDDDMPEETSSKNGQQNEKPALVKPKENSPVISGALSLLMQDYGSDSESNEPVEVSSKIEPPKKAMEHVKKVKIVPAPNLYPTRKRQNSLLEKLLSNEIRHERNVVLQCIHYIVKNNFFDNANKRTE